MIKTKSVYEPIDRAKDGLRILATRIRGHGLKKTRYDVWMANLGPSDKIRKKGLPWREFTRRYKAEMAEQPPLDKWNKVIKNLGQKFTLRLLHQLGKRGTVTVMCHCPEEATDCHRFILKDLIDRAFR